MRMLTRDGKLIVFETFVVDRGLPKFRKTKSKGGAQKSKFGPHIGEGSDEDDEPQFGDSGSFSVLSSASGSFVVTTSTVDGKVADPQSRPWYRRIADAFFRNKPEEHPAPPPPQMDIGEFFKTVQNSAAEIKLVEARLAGYVKALGDAERNGQTALFEKIGKDILVVRAETQLHAIGFSRYISEETLVSFVKKCPKGLRLDYIRNFMRVIPNDVAAKKTWCDDVGAFDNYVVLHYDPEAKSWAQTEQEKQEEAARKRDPILFGLIQGSRRLYFVGDWVDERCDLTLEQIADMMGAEAISVVSPQYDPRDG